MIGSTSSSTLADIPVNLLGSGPIILTSWGTSRLPIVQNFNRAFIHLHTFSSDGFPCNTIYLDSYSRVIPGSLFLQDANKIVGNEDL